MTFLAEILPQIDLFSEYDRLAPGMVVAGLLFLLLVCTGAAAGVGLAMYWIKRPVRLPELTGRLASRALPWQAASIFFGGLIGFYLLTSWGYILLFPEGETGPQTVFFQALFFHLPVLILLGMLFHFAGIRGKELFGLQWEKTPVLLGISLVYYLASMPLVWFCSVLSQLSLHFLGCDFYLQDVSEILIAPAAWPVRTVLFFIAIVVAPVFEEVVFRGILLPFAVRRIGFWPGMMGVALIFGGIHFHLPSFAPLFLFSVLLSLAYARTQSLLVPVGMHMVFNGVSILALLLTI